MTALANGSQQILSGLRLWRELAGYVEAIRSIHISERGRFGAARIEASAEHVPALGYTVENQTLGRVLWERLRHARRLTVVAPGKVVALRPDAQHTEVAVERSGAHAAAPFMCRSISATVVGTPFVNTSGPLRVTCTSSSMRMPMPRQRLSTLLSPADT